MSVSLAHGRSTSEEKFVTSTQIKLATLPVPQQGNAPRDKLLANWILRGGSALKWVTVTLCYF